MSMSRIDSCVAAVVAVVLLSMGCASTGRVQQELAVQMQTGNYAGAIQLVEQHKNDAFDGKNRLIYYLELGMLLQIEGRYEESNIAFEHAKRIGDELYTLSLSNEGLSLMTNDYALDYAGHSGGSPMPTRARISNAR